MRAVPPPVEAAFARYPAEARARLDCIRSLILRVAEEAQAGPVEEALRWGEPAYLAPKGSTIRLGMAKTGEAALFVNCRTTLIEDFKPMAPEVMRLEGNRAVLLDDMCDETALALLIRRALTWHRRS